jgi:hypothetical protein
MTTPLSAYEGWYSMPGFAVETRISNGALTVAFPGVPPGFEVVLLPLEAPHTFRMRGGPGDGATVVFHPDESGQMARVVVGGDTELSRSEPPQVEGPPGQGLVAPPLTLEAEKRAAFDALIADILAAADVRVLDYRLPYPRHEFLQYAALQDRFIFHGSGKMDIDEFVTRRTSMELRDRTGRGNVQGIYGTHDGLWPMFFAIVDRERLTGSIRNGFGVHRNDAGSEVKVYHFSINRDLLDQAPWRTGAIYFLARETFRRMPLSSEGGESNEWVSEVPLKPLARLVVEPKDFPFLDQIGGHDDSELLRFGELGKQVVKATLAAESTPDLIRMKLSYTPELGATVLEYISLARAFIPVGAFALRFLPDGETWYEFAGPPAVMQVLRNQLDKHLAVT